MAIIYTDGEDESAKERRKARGKEEFFASRVGHAVCTGYEELL
jgi:hypothetical protein